MYYIEPDYSTPNLCYIYRDTDFKRELVATVYYNIDLARDIIDFLNKKNNK